MPANARSLAVTDAYRGRLLQLRQRTGVAVAAAWGVLSLDDLDESYRRWLAAAVPLVAAGKREAARSADGYVAGFLSSETGRRVAPAGLRAGEYAAALDGRELRVALRPPLVTVKLALAQRRSQREALNMGLRRALRTSSMEVVQTARLAQADAMTSRTEVQGWRRALAAGACGACMGAADGRVHDSADVPDVHAHCRCVGEPVVRGVRDRVERPTGEQVWDSMTPEQQDRVFAGRGGARKADLIRTGEVSLDQLVTTSSMKTTANVITETPLAHLT